MKSILLLLFALCLAGCSSTAENSAVAETADKVLVLKARREMQLLKEGRVLKTYKIAMGDQPVGHKQQEGDERTPEGRYTLDWRNSKSAYHKSIHISYPSEQDKARAKRLGVSPGGDIMIHGMAKKMAWIGALHTAKDWTNGCIAVTNEEMDEIWAMVKNGTEIEILP
ncbi:murein L,D-transpeptidase family protein [Cesiribacter sp. SM1]|uniref:L,D-transpeptidase family protein n=1 Tax=Cesiribacter sp. SM1 TaxID=2861196 RepID=UPI001CD4BDAA|nr:L,D-transpeptidase family protein [Cesiribacter sp. SM1]